MHHSKRRSSNRLHEQRKGHHIDQQNDMRICQFQSGHGKHSQKLEMYVNSYYAMQFQNGSIEWDPQLILQSDMIFTNARSGEQASKQIWQSVCSTNKKDEAFKLIVGQGTVHITAQERQLLHQNEHRRAQRLLV